MLCAQTTAPPAWSLPADRDFWPAFAAAGREGWASLTVQDIVSLHFCGLGDVTAAAGIPGMLAQHLETGPWTQSACESEFIQPYKLTVESAGAEPGWLQSSRLMTAILSWLPEVTEYYENNRVCHQVRQTAGANTEAAAGAEASREAAAVETAIAASEAARETVDTEAVDVAEDRPQAAVHGNLPPNAEVDAILPTFLQHMQASAEVCECMRVVVVWVAGGFWVWGSRGPGGQGSGGTGVRGSWHPDVQGSRGPGVQGSTGPRVGGLGVQESGDPGARGSRGLGVWGSGSQGELAVPVLASKLLPVLASKVPG